MFNLFGAISENVGQFTQLGAMHYANASGLTDKQLQAQKEADIRKKELQKKMLTYGLIALAVIGIVLIAIFGNKK